MDRNLAPCKSRSVQQAASRRIAGILIGPVYDLVADAPVCLLLPLELGIKFLLICYLSLGT